MRTKMVLDTVYFDKFIDINKKSEKLVTHAFDNLVRNIILEESKSISSCVLQIDKLYKIAKV